MRSALLALLILTTPALAETDLDGSFAELPRSDQGVVSFYLGRGMKDPDSLQYRNVRRYYDGKRLTLCGEANIRNSFGGYIGFERFAIVVPADNRASTYSPLAFDPEVRPDIRAAVARQGC